MEFVASVIGVAAVGVKLSRTLYTIGGRAAGAKHNINRIATNITLFSSSLKHVGHVLGDSQSLHTPEAAETVQQIMDQCERLFEEIARMASGSRNPRDSHSLIAANDSKIRMTILNRIRWSFEQPKVEGLLAQLEYLKTTLCIVIQTLSLAAITAKTRQEAVPSEQQLDQVKEERLHVETLVWAQQLNITIMNEVCVTSNVSSRQHSPSPDDSLSDDASDNRSPKLLTFGEEVSPASLVRLGGHLDFLDSAIRNNTETPEHAINLPADLVDELLQRWTRLPIAQTAHLLEAQIPEPDDLTGAAVKVQGSPPSVRARGSSLDTVHEGEMQPPDLKLEKVDTPSPSSYQEPAQFSHFLDPNTAHRPRQGASPDIAMPVELPTEPLAVPPPPMGPAMLLSRTISNPEQDLPPRLQITPHTHPVHGHTGLIVSPVSNDSPPPQGRSMTAPGANPQSPSTINYYTSGNGSQSGPRPLSQNTNYRRPYVSSVRGDSPPPDYSDREDFVDRQRQTPGKTPVRRDSGLAQTPQSTPHPRRDSRASISEAGLEIPWRIRISKNRYFDFLDSKIVGPRTPYKPAESLDWILGHPDARTEISKEWVTEAALAELRCAFFELNPQELRSVAAQGWVPCEVGVWRILRALTYVSIFFLLVSLQSHANSITQAEVDGLVERTATLYKERAGRGQATPQQRSGPPVPPGASNYSRGMPNNTRPMDIPKVAPPVRSGSFTEAMSRSAGKDRVSGEFVRGPSSYNAPGHELPWLPPPRAAGEHRNERPGERTRDRYHDDRYTKRDRSKDTDYGARDSRKTRDRSFEEKRKKRHSAGATFAKLGALTALLDGIDNVL